MRFVGALDVGRPERTRGSLRSILLDASRGVRGRGTCSVVLWVTIAALALTVPGASAAPPESPYLPSPVHLEGLLFTVAAGTEGTFWFSSWSSGPQSAVGRVSPTGEADVLARQSHPGLIPFAGGVLWAEGGEIEGITNSGETIRYPRRRPDAHQAPLAFGADGSLWYRLDFTDARGRRRAEIDRIDEDTPILRVPIPAVTRVRSSVVGPEGTFWAIDPGPGRPNLLRISPAGHLSRLPLPRRGLPEILASDPAGDLFMTEYRSPPRSYGQAWIDRLTPAGAIKRFRLRGIHEIADLTAGPDGDLWFTGRVAAGPRQIDSMTPGGVVATPTCIDPACALSADALAGSAEGPLFVAASRSYPTGVGGPSTGVLAKQAAELEGSLVGRFVPPSTAVAIEP
jgi:streptogramin lyase